MCQEVAQGRLSLSLITNSLSLTSTFEGEPLPMSGDYNSLLDTMLRPSMQRHGGCGAQVSLGAIGQVLVHINHGKLILGAG